MKRKLPVKKFNYRWILEKLKLFFLRGVTDDIKVKTGALMQSWKSCLESKLLPVLGLALKLSCSCFCFASCTDDLSHFKQFSVLKNLTLVSLLTTAVMLPFFSDQLLHFFVVVCGISIHQVLYYCVSELTKGSLCYQSPCRQNCAILCSTFTLLGGGGV